MIIIHDHYMIIDDHYMIIIWSLHYHLVSSIRTIRWSAGDPPWFETAESAGERQLPGLRDRVTTVFWDVFFRILRVLSIYLVNLSIAMQQFPFLKMQVWSPPVNMFDRQAFLQIVSQILG
jgi:hypothetical protein